MAESEEELEWMPAASSSSSAPSRRSARLEVEAARAAASTMVEVEEEAVRLGLLGVALGVGEPSSDVVALALERTFKGHRVSQQVSCRGRRGKEPGTGRGPWPSSSSRGPT